MRGSHDTLDDCRAVERDPHRISGDWAFKGTRVPVYVFFGNIESGATVPEFLEWYPEVKAWQVTAILTSGLSQGIRWHVKILFDPGTPASLRRHLPGYAVNHSAEKGWDRLKNGDLIHKAEEEGYNMIWPWKKLED